MENLYEYLIFQQMEKDLSFLTEEQIDEGKLKDHVKRAWQWLKGKFKRNKKDKKDKEENKEVLKDKKYTFEIYEYSQVYKKIFQNNNLKKGIDIVDKGYNNKYKIALAEDENGKAIGCLFFITHNNYDRPQEFIEYKDYEHIFSMQIDKNYFNQGISESLLKKVLLEVQKYSSYKGITLDIHEYNTKPNLYQKYFDVKKLEDSKIAVLK